MLTRRSMLAASVGVVCGGSVLANQGSGKRDCRKIANRDMGWFYCLHHARVYQGSCCNKWASGIGPYRTREEADQGLVDGRKLCGSISKVRDRRDAIKGKEIGSLVFQYNDIEVLELIVEQRDGRYTLAWIRTPIDKLTVDGKDNSFVHANFDYFFRKPIVISSMSDWVVTHDHSCQSARYSVRSAFAEYWCDGDSMLSLP